MSDSIDCEGVGEGSAGSNQGCVLVRSISWKQGVIIAMGVPILILPSLYDISGVLWAFSIIIWGVSVLQGFLQNFAIGEMAATFQVTGIPGCAQLIFSKKDSKSRFDRGKFLGAFCAWSYWFTWTPVIPIFTIMAGTYLREFIEPLSAVDPTVLNLIVGFLIFTLIMLVGMRGLTGGARLGLVLALVTILPLIVVVSLPFFTGEFSFSTLTSQLLPPEWNWGAADIFMLFGCFAIAQWSACAWETAAVYGTEYKNPGRDLPKALIGCGLICLFVYILVATSVFGTLGIEGINEAGYATLVPIAILNFGSSIGSAIALFLLIAGMIMLIQTAFLGTSRTLHSMGHEGNMPKLFSKTNSRGAPVMAMLFQFVVGMCMIPLGSAEMILAASSFGFCLALGMAMLAFVVSRTSPRFKNIERPWHAPRGWLGVALCLMIYQFFVLIPCLAYWSISIFGLSSVILGVCILLAYIPVWFALQNYNNKHKSDDYSDESKHMEVADPKI